MSDTAGPPEDWARIKAIFCDALERPEPERAAFVAQACAGARHLEREVQSLLASHARADAEAFIERGVGSSGDAAWVGRRLGPYRIESVLGHGGMGSVFRAVRDDDAFRKAVAIKVVRRGLDPALVSRFRAERQILAGLDHPGIARLIDGGTTDDGLPYLVMDFVEGEPITGYAEAHGLTVRARLALFRAVCAAVEYAHRNLVVHRDLKPSNILVTADGAPKLLDFGIAKLLAVEPRELEPTITMLRPMTPEYASPEEVRGLAVTTASDVYSLGVLLCELLTGERPYELGTRDPMEMARIVATTEPARPSVLAARRADERWRAQLEGDLDTIVLAALRKEPERRYGSVAQLSDDVLRYLDGRPVSARPDTFGYRAGKLVARNRGVFAAAAALLLSLVGGIVATAWQARVARRERARAERRFEDVRGLASSFLFEFNDAVEKLPGSTPARQLLVTRGLAYLDRLAQEGGDAALDGELARGYLRLGDLQGRPNFANLGDFSGALASYRKGLDLARRAAAAAPRDLKARQDVATALNRIGTLLDDRFGDVTGALAAEREALAVQESVVASAPDDAAPVRGLLAIETKLGDIQAKNGRPEDALAAFERALPRYEAIATRSGAAQDRFNLFVAHAKVGGALALLGREPEALARYDAMLSLGRAMVAADPHDAPARRALAVGLNKVGDLVGRRGDTAKALALYRESLALREALAPADPRNVLARSDLVGSYLRIGDVMARTGDDAGALTQYRLALPILEALAARDAASPAGAADLQGAVARLAMLEARTRPAAALARYEHVVPTFEAALAVDPGNLESRYDLACALLDRARLLERAAPERGATGWREARAAFERAHAAWQPLADRAITGAHFDLGTPAVNVRAAESGLARCDRELRVPLAAPR